MIFQKHEQTEKLTETHAHADEFVLPEYKNSEEFENFTVFVKDEIEKLFAAGSLDEGSGKILDVAIAALAKKNLEELSKQEQNHVSLIANYGRNRAQETMIKRTEMEKRLPILNNKISATQKELADIEERERHFKFKKEI